MKKPLGVPKGRLKHSMELRERKNPVPYDSSEDPGEDDIFFSPCEVSARGVA